MNVLHVISGLDPKSGGPAIALAGLTEALTATGVGVTIAATWADGQDLSLADQLRNHGIGVHLIGPCRDSLSRHPLISSTLQGLIADADIVHIHAIWEQIHHEAAKIAYRRQVPYIIRPCGMLDPWSLTQGWLKKRLYLAWRLRTHLNRAAAIHFTSRTERELTKPLGLTNASSIVEPNGVDLSEFLDSPKTGAFRVRHPQVGDRPLVLFLSRLHRKKGLDLLIPAFAKARTGNAVLVIAGPDSDGYRSHVETMVKQANLNNQVVFTGMLQGLDRVAALYDADLFVLPSYQENFGIVVIEALAAGTPVLISDCVNIHDQITAAGVGGVVPTNVDALAEAISRWIGDETLRHKAAIAAQPFVREHYDWQHIAQHWHDHYAELIKRTSS